MNVNPYDPPTAQAVVDQRASKRNPALVRIAAGCGILLGVSFIAAVVLFGDTQKRVLDSVGIVLLPAQFLIVVLCLIFGRKLKKSKANGMSD